MKPDARPVSEPIEKRSPKKEKFKKRARQELMLLGVLEPSVSALARNIVFVRKKDRSIRVTSDSGQLKNPVSTASYPVENLRDIQACLGSESVFLILNLSDVFFQVELNSASRTDTATQAMLGPLQYKLLHHGLKTSPGTFQSTVSTVLGELTKVDVLVSLDDTSTRTNT